MENETKNKIKFDNLSTPNKIAIILAWITGTLTIISFIIGMLTGLTTP